MRVRMRPTTLQGQPVKGEGEVFAGETAMDVLAAMQRATDGGSNCPLHEYMGELVARANQMAGVHIELHGDTLGQRAVCLLDALIKHGLAEELPDGPAPVSITPQVWLGLEAVRQSGLTNMLDRPRVARLAREMGCGEAASWIEEHPKEYSEGVFRGFRTELTSDD